MMEHPYSCDTFVALPPCTVGNAVIFGKNSDRPKSEVQEVVYFPKADYDGDKLLQCTYITIPQASHTYAVMLSKPAWMWGAEMGSNEKGVCIGNEAVSTKLQQENDADEKLLGMDLVRLGLERGGTAAEALDHITTLLETNGQGGPCTEDPDNITTYHNSFIIADPQEAWILETAGKHWAAEKVTEGVRNISNQLSIGTNITKMSSGLMDLCKEKDYWNPEEPFDFAKVMTKQMPPTMFSKDETPNERFEAGKKLMDKYADEGFSASSMMTILRDTSSHICRIGTGARSIASTGSQVSILYPSTKPSIHWFTATPNPACSTYKPFVFTKDSSVHLENNKCTQSKLYAKDPAKEYPRFQFSVDRGFALYKAHALLNPLPGDEVNEVKLRKAKELERKNLTRMEEMYDGNKIVTDNELAGWWGKSVQNEMEIYVDK